MKKHKPYTIICINDDLEGIDMIKDVSVIDNGDIEITINIDPLSTDNCLSNYIRLSSTEELGGFDLYKSTQTVNGKPTFVIFRANNNIDSVVVNDLSAIMSYCFIYKYHIVNKL